MANIVNLRAARKSKIRAAAEAKAAEKRLAFGRSKGDKKREALLQKQAQSELDGHRLTFREDER